MRTCQIHEGPRNVWVKGARRSKNPHRKLSTVQCGQGKKVKRDVQLISLSRKGDGQFESGISSSSTVRDTPSGTRAVRRKRLFQREKPLAPGKPPRKKGDIGSHGDWTWGKGILIRRSKTARNNRGCLRTSVVHNLYPPRSIGRPLEPSLKGFKSRVGVGHSVLGPHQSAALEDRGEKKPGPFARQLGKKKVRLRPRSLIQYKKRKGQASAQFGTQNEKDHQEKVRNPIYQPNRRRNNLIESTASPLLNLTQLGRGRNYTS